MHITAIKTPKLTVGSTTLKDLLDRSVAEFRERNILAVTSKIVSLCEGRALPIGTVEKDKLVVQEADKYLPAALSKYGYALTIKNNTLILAAGIDESNTDGYYALWPRDAQRTCNEVHAYLLQRFSLKEAGVIITDSTCQPLVRGTTGICLAHSGFAALNNYIGRADLFGKPMQVTQANVSGGLAAAAVACMGEGSEQTPLAVISDVDYVQFQPRNPTRKELQQLHLSLEDDLFAPLLGTVTWRDGILRR